MTAILTVADGYPAYNARPASSVDEFEWKLKNIARPVLLWRRVEMPGMTVLNEPLYLPEQRRAERRQKAVLRLARFA